MKLCISCTRLPAAKYHQPNHDEEEVQPPAMTSELGGSNVCCTASALQLASAAPRTVPSNLVVSRVVAGLLTSYVQTGSCFRTTSVAFTTETQLTAIHSEAKPTRKKKLSHALFAKQTQPQWREDHTLCFSKDGHQPEETSCLFSS